jgi:hypothetical protein
VHGRTPDRKAGVDSIQAYQGFEYELDLVFAATARHWLDSEIRYRRAWELPRPWGPLAFWSASDVFPEGSDAFFREIQDVYDEIGEGLSAGTLWWPTTETGP